MASVRHIVFDLDGTLVHSAPDIHAAINVVLRSNGRPELDIETVTSFVGNGVEKLVERSLNATGGVENALHQKALEQFVESYNADPFSRTEPYPGVISCLESFRGRGIKLAICTNKPADTAKEICTALQIDQYFEVISGAVHGVPKKPDPTPLTQVIATLGGDITDTVYVGDSTVDQATARNANIPFILFSGGYLNAQLTEPHPAIIFSDWHDDWCSALIS